MLFGVDELLLYNLMIDFVLLHFGIQWLITYFR